MCDTPEAALETLLELIDEGSLVPSPDLTTQELDDINDILDAATFADWREKDGPEGMEDD